MKSYLFGHQQICVPIRLKCNHGITCTHCMKMCDKREIHNCYCTIEIKEDSNSFRVNCNCVEACSSW